LDKVARDPLTIDVHGNQNGLLRTSACFRMSGTLTCNSCHNPHEREKGNAGLFSQRCMSCHNSDVHVDFRKQTGISDEALKSNCIDCHMPLKSSAKVAVMLPGDVVPTAALIRSHRIAVYPGETNRILNSMAAPQKN
jgi:hypothetical protein